jgi:hypothetical protein
MMNATGNTVVQVLSGPTRQMLRRSAGAASPLSSLFGASLFILWLSLAGRGRQLLRDRGLPLFFDA